MQHLLVTKLHHFLDCVLVGKSCSFIFFLSMFLSCCFFQCQVQIIYVESFIKHFGYLVQYLLVTKFHYFLDYMFVGESSSSSFVFFLCILQFHGKATRLVYLIKHVYNVWRGLLVTKATSFSAVEVNSWSK